MAAKPKKKLATKGRSRRQAAGSGGETLSSSATGEDGAGTASPPRRSAKEPHPYKEFYAFWQKHSEYELLPEFEFGYSLGRKWRFDFVHPMSMVAIELDGGGFIGGRHTSGAGYEKDAAKTLVAAALGYLVIHLTPAMMVKHGSAIVSLLGRMMSSRSIDLTVPALADSDIELFLEIGRKKRKAKRGTRKNRK